MSTTISFRDTLTNVTVHLELERGAIIPRVGNHISSPFNEEKVAIVSNVSINDAHRFEISCTDLK
jgi:hypothetical protein